MRRQQRSQPGLILLLLLCVALTNATRAELPAPSASFFTQHCIDCHDQATQEGGLDLTGIGRDLTDPAVLAKWVRVYDRIQAGEMPPPDADQPTPEQRTGFLAPLAAELTAAHARAKGTVLRRLNRHEYERTLNALLGTHVQVADLLPEDGMAHGFDNIGAALDLSPVQMQRYLEAAGIALDACVSFGPRPASESNSYTYASGRNESNLGKSWILRDDGAVVISTQYSPSIKIHEMRIRETARYRFRLYAAAHRSEEPVVYRVHAGRDFFDSMPLLDVCAAPPGEFAPNEFEVLLRENETVRVWPELPVHWLSDEDTKKYEGPGLALLKLEVEGPLYDEWPLRGHRLRFGDLPAEDTGPENQRSKPWYKPRYQLVSADPAADLARVLQPFLEAAFRRPVDAESAAPFVAIGQDELAAGQPLDQALRTAQLAALCSADFLYLIEPDGALDDYALAARLSYMLWGTPPDETLRAMAAKNQLRDAQTLHAQTERLLNDPRAGQFTENFTGHWLNLREIDFTTPDKQLYPEYDVLLRHAMLRETEMFFDEMLAKNLSVLNFIDSDWTFANARLAEHYGLEDVDGVAMRRVALRPEDHRGGVLAHASVLKVSANGTTTSPVTRGAYVLSRILGVEPPPPPAGVPGVEPDIRGATTLREQLDKHRSIQSCNICHRVLDPPGFALENYDVMGGWRENYRSLGHDFPKPDESQTGGRHVQWRIGPAVDPAGETPDGQAFSNLSDYKQILLANPQQFTRALATKLAIYATGRSMGFSDRPEIDRIVDATAQDGYGLRTLVHAIVASEIFHNR
ncbi:MAG: DUF1592 domain-containing protein [Planctomycetales bacterium]|nr:DUF1592 domain-containing protein [Planctomycetales bacterium]